MAAVRRVVHITLSLAGAVTGILLLLAGTACPGAVIKVSPADSPAEVYSKIESARAGDEVIIAPGTYTCRVHLAAQGTAERPITIRAEDPANRPVWDFGSKLVEDAPGSYKAGDRGRGAWQISGGAFYRISGIVFKGARCASRNSAGIRYYNHTTDLLIRDCIFRSNDDGLTGGTQHSDATVEFCEFDGNGNADAKDPTHNLYIYGGFLTLRYCYVHDSAQASGANFHIRAEQSTLEYNWFARAANYEGDLMSNDDFNHDKTGGPFVQTMLLRGNVFLQGAHPGNHSHIVVAYNDTKLANLTLNLIAINNTCVANGIRGEGGEAAFVRLSNSDGTAMSAIVSNNLIFDTKVPTLANNPARGKISGRGNWMATGVNPGPLTESVFSATPGFRNAAAKDFTLAPGSAAIKGAAPFVPLGATKEYFQNETTARQYRRRTSTNDIGAFESTTAGGGIDGSTDRGGGGK